MYRIFSKSQQFMYTINLVYCKLWPSHFHHFLILIFLIPSYTLRLDVLPFLACYLLVRLIDNEMEYIGPLPLRHVSQKACIFVRFV